MRIYNIALALFVLLLPAPCRAGSSTMRDFILQRQGSEVQVRELCVGAGSVNMCTQTPTHLLCVHSGMYPNIGHNPQARIAIARSLALKAKMAVYAQLLQNSPPHLLNTAGVRETYLQGVDRGQEGYVLKGVEFQTYAEDNWCGAIASAPLAAEREIRKKCAEPGFIMDYCGTLYPCAISCMQEGKYREALTILKELHDLKYANIDAYLLTCEAFIKNNQPGEAQKIANELLADFYQSCTVQQAEQLGDIFLELGAAPEAEKSYVLAQELMNK